MAIILKCDECKNEFYEKLTKENICPITTCNGKLLLYDNNEIEINI